LDYFLSSSYSVVRLSILASQAKDSGSNPDGSIIFSVRCSKYAHDYDNSRIEKVTILDPHSKKNYKGKRFDIVALGSDTANGHRNGSN
jgi:hypothetical protein